MRHQEFMTARFLALGLMSESRKSRSESISLIINFQSECWTKHPWGPQKNNCFFVIQSMSVVILPDWFTSQKSHWNAIHNDIHRKSHTSFWWKWEFATSLNFHMYFLTTIARCDYLLSPFMELSITLRERFQPQRMSFRCLEWQNRIEKIQLRFGVKLNHCRPWPKKGDVGLEGNKEASASVQVIFFFKLQ